MNFTLQRPIRTGALLFTRADIRHGVLLIAPALLAFVAVLLYAVYQVYSTNQELSADQQQLSQLSHVRAPLVAAQADVERAKSTIKTLEMHRMSALEPLERLVTLNDSLPSNVRLSKVTMNGDALTVVGDTMHPGDLIAAQAHLSGLKVTKVEKTTTSGAYTWNGSFK